MKTLIAKRVLIAAFLGACTVRVAIAVEPGASTGHAKAASDDAASDMTGADVSGSGRADQMLRQRQKEMLEMHELMHRIRDAKDPKEKARLMDEHLQMLRDSWEEMKAQRRQRPRSRPMMPRRDKGANDAGQDDTGPTDEP
jgi:hypothetical protein